MLFIVRKELYISRLQFSNFQIFIERSFNDERKKIRQCLSRDDEALQAQQRHLPALLNVSFSANVRGI